MKKHSALFLLLLLLALFLTACSQENSSIQKADKSVSNSFWIITKMEGKPLSASKTKSDYHLKFGVDKPNRFNGFAGCNQIFGEFQIDANKLTFLNVGRTKMACDDLMTEENILRNLKEVTDYKITGDTLLLNKDGNCVLLCKRGLFQ